MATDKPKEKEPLYNGERTLTGVVSFFSQYKKDGAKALCKEHCGMTLNSKKKLVEQLVLRELKFWKKAELQEILKGSSSTGASVDELVLKIGTDILPNVKIVNAKRKISSPEETPTKKQKSGPSVDGNEAKAPDGKEAGKTKDTSLSKLLEKIKKDECKTKSELEMKLKHHQDSLAKYLQTKHEEIESNLQIFVQSNPQLARENFDKFMEKCRRAEVEKQMALNDFVEAEKELEKWKEQQLPLVTQRRKNELQFEIDATKHEIQRMEATLIERKQHIEKLTTELRFM